MTIRSEKFGCLLCEAWGIDPGKVQGVSLFMSTGNVFSATLQLLPEMSDEEFENFARNSADAIEKISMKHPEHGTIEIEINRWGPDED